MKYNKKVRILVLAISFLLTIGFTPQFAITAMAEGTAGAQQTAEITAGSGGELSEKAGSSASGNENTAQDNAVNDSTGGTNGTLINSTDGSSSSTGLKTGAQSGTDNALAYGSNNIADETATVDAIYLNGRTGKDENDGTSPEKAVHSFARAKELAAADDHIKTIYIIGTVQVSGDVSLAGTSAVIKRDKSMTDYLFMVANSATFHDITIDGNSQEVTAKSSLIHVVYDGEVTINDGTVLENNVISNKPSVISSNGGAISVQVGTLYMNGGVIRNNTACIGGGVCLQRAKMYMTGGTITGNHALNAVDDPDNPPIPMPGGGKPSMIASGGGIGAYSVPFGQGLNKSSTINLSGGLIDANTSEGMGGGIGLGHDQASDKLVLNMTGGTISNNTSKECGAGIFLQCGAKYKQAIANISAGKIINNHMLGGGVGSDAFGGGGIYVNGAPNNLSGYVNAELHLKNAIITGNSAAVSGGGYAACPVSKTHIYLKNGSAFYGNTAPLGAELYIIGSYGFGTHAGTPEYTISDTMLGGEPYNWKDNDGVEVPLNKLEGKLNASKNEELALHTDVTSSDAAESLATVWITGNTSTTRGGGIGSNGTVTVGEYDTTTLHVSKTWSNDDAQNRPSSIQVNLYRHIEGGDSVYVGHETMTPDQNGAWELTFTNLPKADPDDNTYIYTVKEEHIDGYAAKITGNQQDGYTINNDTFASVSVTKTWKDDDNQYKTRPDSIIVNLLANGKKVDSKTVKASDEWKCTFDHLAIKDDEGKDITYSVSEEKVSGYETEITGSVDDGYTITNTSTYVPPVSVSVTKSWSDNDDQYGIRQDSITVNLLANGEKVDSKTVKATDDWKCTFENLAKKDNDGKDIAYTVSEDPIKNYTSEVTGSMDDGYTITNTSTYVPPVSVSVTKAWNDGDNQYKTRPDSITVNLLANGEKVDSRTVKATDDWKCTFENLAKKDNDGKDIAYTVSEDPVKNYTSEVTGSAADGYTITNTPNNPTPSTTQVSVKKVWKLDNGGTAASFVQVQLYRNGEAYGDPVTLSAATNWAYT